MSESFSITTGGQACVPIRVNPEAPSPASPLRLWALPSARAVADHVAAELLGAMGDGSGWPLGLATGRTMESVYAALAGGVAALNPQLQQRVRHQWLSFNLDEYIGISPGDARSFAGFMGSHLVRPLGLDPARVRLPDGLAPDPAAEARCYGQELAAAGGIGLQLLGLGLNGHVGFNEPPCVAEAATRVVELSPTTRRQNAAAFGDDPAAVPARAITVGLKEILSAKRILLVVTGAAKAPILRALLHGPVHEQLPASWLKHHARVEVIADRAALRQVVAQG